MMRRDMVKGKYEEGGMEEVWEWEKKKGRGGEGDVYV